MYSSFLRRIYAGGRPNRIARFMNRIGAIVASTGLIAPNLMVTLEVIGRKSGRIITFPVVVAPYKGERYLASMLGDEAQWVQNVRAAGGQAWIRSGSRAEVHLEEVPAHQRAPILKAYLQRAPGARPHIPVDKDAPLSAFEAIQADYPCFRMVTK